MKKKIILITAGIQNTPRGVRVLSVNGTYMDAVAAAGGIPVMLGNTRLAPEYAEMADGLILTGGESVHPTRYGETFMHLADGDPTIAHNLKTGCNSVRDEMEFAAFEAFFEKKKPILGICRGHQLVNAATEGANMLNFPRKHAVEHSEGIAHEVLAQPDSVLGRLYGERFLVNSFHRDCASSVGPQVRITAKSPDGIIEAIEHKELPVFGVQFHPERMRGDNPLPALGVDGTKLFEYFVNIC